MYTHRHQAAFQIQTNPLSLIGLLHKKKSQLASSWRQHGLLCQCKSIGLMLLLRHPLHHPQPQPMASRSLLVNNYSQHAMLCQQMSRTQMLRRHR